MRAVTRLLLGTSAILVVASTASAADLPVKARPVEYVKVCTLYGAGFFYVPGTDTCLKMGAYLRSDHAYGGGSLSAFYFSNTSARFTRSDTNFYTYRARVNLTTDWRTQTDYGALRAYAAIIAQQQSAGASTTGTAGILRAFIQFAGFTAGHAVSHFDFFSLADYSYISTTPYNSTATNGIDLISYTWQMGNGFSASVSIEDGGNTATPGSGPGRGKLLFNASQPAQLGAAGAATTLANNSLASWQPDVVGNVRIDQAWGSAQLMGALHNAAGGYYGGAGSPSVASLTSNGHPGDAWGWAAGAGVRLLNFLAPRDTIEAQVDYGRGATGYVTTLTSFAGNAIFGGGNSVGLGYATDGVFVSGSGVELTEAWSVSLAYQHYWSANWRTAVAGGYSEIRYNNSAKGMLCGTNANSAGAGSGLSTVFGAFTPGAGFSCNPNFSMAAVNTRTAWTPHPTLEIGLDLVWAHLDTAFAGLAIMGAANGARPPGSYKFENQHNFLGVLRIQKNVLP